MAGPQGDGPPGDPAGCECEFEYPYRWPQFYESLLSDYAELVAKAVALLAERDSTLETHFAQRCCNGSASCLFEYPIHWPAIFAGLLSQDESSVNLSVGVLDENDRALEQHLRDRPCFGINYPAGITCEFDYPSRWPQFVDDLLSGDVTRVEAAIGVMEERDRALELHLKLRICHPIS